MLFSLCIPMLILALCRKPWEGMCGGNLWSRRSQRGFRRAIEDGKTLATSWLIHQSLSSTPFEISNHVMWMVSSHRKTFGRYTWVSLLGSHDPPPRLTFPDKSRNSTTRLRLNWHLCYALDLDFQFSDLTWTTSVTPTVTLRDTTQRFCAEFVLPIKPRRINLSSVTSAPKSLT